MSVLWGEVCPFHQLSRGFYLSIDTMGAGSCLLLTPMVASSELRAEQLLLVPPCRVEGVNIRELKRRRPFAPPFGSDEDLSVGERPLWARGFSCGPSIGVCRGPVVDVDMFEGDPQPLARILTSSGSLGDEAGLCLHKKRLRVLVKPLEPLSVEGPPPVVAKLALALGVEAP
ncbi:hypothetical protein BHE74_00001266 [Ensete ventricosum]|nr:hypothetical protein BHE74_00001266 [Ensete ventricosum]RZR87301.1 hypothetical protein BHM03_00014665 [Ensete ventricosum]